MTLPVRHWTNNSLEQSFRSKSASFLEREQCTSWYFEQCGWQPYWRKWFLAAQASFKEHFITHSDIFRLDNTPPPQTFNQAASQAGLQQTVPRASKGTLQPPSSPPPAKLLPTWRPVQTDKTAKTAFPTESSVGIAGGAIKPTTSAKRRNVSESPARGDRWPSARRRRGGQLPKPGAARALPGRARRGFPEQTSSGAGGPVSNWGACGGQVCISSIIGQAP